jgi:hypothetical protein
MGRERSCLDFYGLSLAPAMAARSPDIQAPQDYACDSQSVQRTEAAMTAQDNAYKAATGKAPHEDFDFIAYTGDKKTWAPTWGFVTSNWSPLVMFKIGGSFGGFHYGVQGYGGYPDDNGNIGPQINDYSDFAGVLERGCTSRAWRAHPSTTSASTARRGRIRIH